MHENELSSLIIGAAIEVHKALGPGLLESAYEVALRKELLLRNLEVKQQLVLPVVYKGEKCDAGYRIDITVNDKVVVEIKAVEALNDVHLSQVLTCLKLSGCRLGLLINFNVTKLTKGIKRVVNRFEE